MSTSKVIAQELSCPFPYKRILVFPDRILRATILELAMIDTRIMQRLRNTKQLGNSNVSYPTAEHSRFSHSLGVLYWSNKILTALSDNHNAAFNNTKLEELNILVKTYFQEKLPDIDKKIFNNDKYLGVTWFEQLVRLYGLLHDITHIPFGHTIEDQASLFTRHDDDLPRLDLVFDMLKKEVQKSYHFENLPNEYDLIQIAEEYINLIRSMFVMGTITSDPDSDDKTREGWLVEWAKIKEIIHKPLLLSYDIVSNTICADLMDYTMRDTLYAGMPKTFDKALLTCMKIVEYKTTFFLAKKKSEKMFRLGVNISRKKVRHDIITAILDLLRIRYDLTEKVYYHHTKVITDAMLEKILRTLKNEKDLQFTPKEIYEKYLGDEGFMILLESKLKSKIELASTLAILDKTFRRNLYKAIFRINKNEPLSKKGNDLKEKCKSPDDRNGVEKEIIKELAEKYHVNIEEGDIIISYPPPKMQKKVAKALIEWSDGRIFTFENLPMEANYSNEVGILTQRYETLWSMTIYLNPTKIHYLRLVESICEDLFEIHNESILRNYLREKYKHLYESSAVITDINRKVISMESNFSVSKAAKGGAHIDKTEFVENAFNEVISKRKETRQVKVSKTAEKTDDTNPKLDFNEKK
jgi:uncharacterized protein